MGREMLGDVPIKSLESMGMDGCHLLSHRWGHGTYSLRFLCGLT
jgi:hypothetical protein